MKLSSYSCRGSYVGKNTPCSGLFVKYNFKYNFRDWDFLFIDSPGCFILAAASSAQRAGFSPEGTTVSVGISLLLCSDFPRFQTPPACSGEYSGEGAGQAVP